MTEKILLIGTDGIYLKSIRDLLLKLDYTEKDILIYDSVNAAVNIPKANTSIILAQLPEDNTASFNTLHHHYTDVPIIVLCSSDKLPIALQYVAEGAEDYLIKEDTEIKALDKALKCLIAKK